MKTDLVKLSKFLSLVLRHKPEEIGIALDESGWVSVQDLLDACAKHGVDLDSHKLQSVVQTNDKKRFAFSADGKKIRASQGHSLEVDLAYEPATPPDVLYHGTATRFLDSIRTQGLLKQARHHVHLTDSVGTASNVGARYGRAIVLKIRAHDMHQAGYSFFISANNVWLTEHVPVEYIEFS
jgi:putative RNA 2'-phosphotransferase